MVFEKSISASTELSLNKGFYSRQDSEFKKRPWVCSVSLVNALKIFLQTLHMGLALVILPTTVTSCQTSGIYLEYRENITPFRK